MPIEKSKAYASASAITDASHLQLVASNENAGSQANTASPYVYKNFRINSLPIYSYVDTFDDTSETPTEEEGSAKMSVPTREEIQATIAASEARGETKLARFEGKLDLVLTKLDDVKEDGRNIRKEVKEDGRNTRNILITIGVSLALLIIGIVAAAPVIFDLGSRFRETVTKEVHDQISQDATSKK